MYPDEQTPPFPSRFESVFFASAVRICPLPEGNKPSRMRRMRGRNESLNSSRVDMSRGLDTGQRDAMLERTDGFVEGCSGRSEGIRGTAEIRFGFWAVSMRHNGSIRVNVGSLQVNATECSNSK